jgi:hypothetical protein
VAKQIKSHADYKCKEEKKMRRTKFLSGMLAMALVFGMMVIGCDTDGGGSSSGTSLAGTVWEGEGVTLVFTAIEVKITMDDTTTTAPYTLKGSEITINIPSSEGVVKQEGTIIGGDRMDIAGITLTKVTSGTSQPDPVPGGDTITVSNQQVYEMNDNGTLYTGSGTVKIAGGAITVGSITNGKLTFTLPSTVPSQYLYAFSEYMPSGITISPSNARGLSNEGDIGVYDGNRIIDYLFLMKTEGSTMHVVENWYFDRAAKITGSSDGTTASVDAHVGWNKIYMNSTPSSTTITANSTNVPSGMKWVSLRNGGYD